MRSNMLHILSVTKEAGMSLLEAMIAVGIVGILAAGMTSLIRTISDSNARVEQIMDRSMTMDYLSALVSNRESWQMTVAANKKLAKHLQSAPISATSPWHSLALRDVDNKVIIETKGTYLDRNANPVKSTHDARWFVTMEWAGEKFNSGKVRIELTPVKNGEMIKNATRQSLVHRTSQKQKCYTIEQVIVSGGNPAGANVQQGPPYKYDSATVSCPDPYSLLSVNIRPGCGALNPRSDLSPTDSREGSCYQISASHPDQRTLTGCNAGNVSGRCQALCCLID